MKTAYKSVRIWLASMALILAVTLACMAGSSDVHLDVLHFKTGVLTNVTVFSISKTDVFVSHSRGLANIKIADLGDEGLGELGLGPRRPGNANYITAAAASYPAQADQPKSGQSMATFNPNAAALSALKSMIDPLKKQAALIPATVLLVTLGVFLAIYLFFCYCFKLIVQKTGVDPGFLIWLPLFQWIPLFRAAGMSGWWLLAFFLPIVNLVGAVMWSINIVKARDKSGWVTLFLILPVTNFFALLYLAFSSGSDDDNKRPIMVATPPSLSEAA